MKTVLIVDDERNIRDSLAAVLRDEGFEVLSSESAEAAMTEIFKGEIDVALLDVWLPGMDGLAALREIKKTMPSLPVIMITGHGTVETAVKATKLGAYDFLEKPLSIEKVLLSVNHALEQARLAEENRELKDAGAKKYLIIGNSGVMEDLKQDIRKVASSNAGVLITGENGTGKELVARNIHLFSLRSDKPFVAVNCAAIPEELIESELFGHEKGAFTGAVSTKKGRFDTADNGTLFLDEIGDMSTKTQAKILRVLEEKSFERVGGTKKQSVDVRVVAATNKNLEEEIKKGNFREDLYYRLNVIPFRVPPLRERKSDIPVFVRHFLNEFSLETGSGTHSLSDDALALFMSYDWPGNVRELRNLIERLVIMTPPGEVSAASVPSYMRGGAAAATFGETLKQARKGFEREFIVRKLDEFNGNIAKTADAIGIERSHLYRKMKSYGIEQ